MQVETVSTPNSEYIYDFCDVPFDVVREIILPFVYEIYKYDFKTALIKEVAGGRINKEATGNKNNKKGKKNINRYNRVMRQLYYIAGPEINIGKAEKVYGYGGASKEILLFMCESYKYKNQEKINDILNLMHNANNSNLVALPEDDHEHPNKGTRKFKKGFKFNYGKYKYSMCNIKYDFDDEEKEPIIFVKSDILYMNQKMEASKTYTAWDLGLEEY